MSFLPLLLGYLSLGSLVAVPKIPECSMHAKQHLGS